jgi:hypothetical protein
MLKIFDGLGSHLASLDALEHHFIFLMAGATIRRGYMDSFLPKYGAMEGYTIMMTETAFLTMEALKKMSPSLVRGLQTMNEYVQANPQWYMLKIFDGLGSHLASLDALEHHFQNKIFSLKEEPDSSH